jgi:hypothetical protein
VQPQPIDNPSAIASLAEGLFNDLNKEVQVLVNYKLIGKSLTLTFIISLEKTI